MKKRIISIIAMIMVACLFLGLSACSKKDDKTLKLVVAAPMTGDSGDWGTQMWDAATLAVKQINEEGIKGGYKFVLEKQDDKGDAKEGANVAQKLAADDSIFAVLGPCNSAVAMAAMPIYEEAKLPLISSYTSAPAITQQGWKYYCRNWPHDDLQGPQLVKFASDLGYKNFAIITANSDSGIGLMNGCKSEIEAQGLSVACEELVLSQVDKDFSAPLTNIKASGADCLLLLPDYTECGLILKQMDTMGIDMPVVTQSGTLNVTAFELAGDAINGVYAVDTWSPDVDLPFVKQLVESYDAEYGHLPSACEAYTYELPFLIKAAVEKGATREDLIDVIKTISIDGVTGKTEIDENGDVKNKEFIRMIVKDGEAVPYTG